MPNVQPRKSAKDGASYNTSRAIARGNLGKSARKHVTIAPRGKAATPMTNGWTGGQYSLFRLVFAAYLLVRFLTAPPPLLPYWLAVADSSSVTTALRGIGLVLCVLLGIGLYDRAAALGIWFLEVGRLERDPLLGQASVVLLGWLLLAHVFLPPAPYGSWAARGRVDPGGGWRMPPAVFAAAWGVLALSYGASALALLANPDWRDGSSLIQLLHSPLVLTEGLRQLLLESPGWVRCLPAWSVPALELIFVVLAPLPRCRSWIWGLLLIMNLVLLVLLGFREENAALLLLHLFAWDPGWIRPVPGGTERIFYDGYCGLCQRSVRLILAEDATGRAFRFAPLQGETFQSLLPAKEREHLPMSMIAQTESGALLTRSAGVMHILRRLGGIYRVLAGLLSLLPPVLRDRLYDFVARIRHRLFRRPTEACPLMPPHLRTRFDP
jgi:predicted DCC family thiol-disulfide oxidoreductase YuxK